MHTLLDRQSLERLIPLLNTRGKAEATRYARSLTITSEALAGVILAAEVGALRPYAYSFHNREISSERLDPTDEELTALGRAGVGKVTGLARKAIRKMDQQFKERSLLVVHLFHSGSHHLWHMLYFDQRDFKAKGNHWKHGAHIHYSQNSFTREPLRDVWAKVKAPRPEFPPSLHVRFDYHHNRPK